MKDDIKIPPAFCILPWIHRFTNIGGEIQVCCTSEEHDNDIRGDNGQPLRAPADLDDEKIMNSRFMRELRLQMLTGRGLPKLCERCRITEESGGVSRRHTENYRFHSEIPWALAATAADGTVPLKILSNDFRLGNLCNLSCRMCSPRASSRWIAHVDKIAHGLDLSQEAIEEFKSYRWYESDRLEPYFKRLMPTLEHLHFAGGEPLISKKMIHLLRLCVESGHAEHIEVTYNTNLTILPNEINELWPRFRGVRIFCSIDGAGALNELIRYPSKWSEVDQNLRFIEAHHSRLGVKETLVMCTVQAYNVLRLEELYDYLATNFKFVSQLPQLIDLHFPEHLQTAVLPAELKAVASERLEEIEQRTLARIERGEIPAHLAPLLSSLHAARNFMNQNDRQDLAPKFLRAAESFDKVAGQRVFDVVPELRFLKV